MNHAVLIGINTYKSVSGLNGCLNDVEDVASRLVQSASVSEANITRLLDANASKAAIVAAVDAMVSSLKFGERGYIHFSGHGVQLLSNDPEEPDGLDEVLCAYDFDWSSDTAVGDDELYRLLSKRVAGSEVLVTIDCCHSGDQVRTLTAGTTIRTLPIPTSIRAEFLRRKGAVRALRSIARGPGIGFLSACSPWEVAADTSFDGRPNGAFTYYFLRAVTNTPAADLADLALSLRPDLVRYRMTPVAEGETSLVWLARPSTRTLSFRHESAPALRTTSIVRATQIVFERSFDAVLAGRPLGIGIRIGADNGQILLFASASIFGSPVSIPPIAISGDQSLEIPLGVLGARLVVGVRRWSVGGGNISFDLDLSVATGMWFVPAIHVAQVPVVIPVAQLSRSVAPELSSPSDLAALLMLQGRDVEPVISTPTAYRDPRLQVFAAGKEGWGPNWREDRVIRPFTNRPRPEGIQRMHVEIGPQKGSGNVYVVGWASAQETDFDFILHMGNNFFGGWGEIEWRVVGFYYDASPFPEPRAATPKSVHGKNGHALPSSSEPILVSGSDAVGS